MDTYRCYLINAGHIAGVEIVDATNDKHAIESAKSVFHIKPDHYSGFKLWHGARVVHRHHQD